VKTLKFTLLSIVLLGCVAFAAPARGQTKGYRTKKYTKAQCAHMTDFSDMGKVKRISGTLFLGLAGAKPFEYSGIVAVYKVVGKDKVFVGSYLTGTDGRFEFKHIAPGAYYLKTGSIEFGFNCLDVAVVLAPNDSDASNEELEISVELGT
jgi:hypothetical protein